jgi:alanyl-tRNA synthetase
MNSYEIRKKFLDFFKTKGHAIVPSSSLIPTDPSVLFTTAGMQQFKPYFLGEQSPWGKNVASVQKCLRTSDIDDVGDDRHLTFFEMLGNFSFGGYWKKEAIQLAWEFLTVACKLSTANFSITVFGGDNEVPADRESYRIWREEIGIPEEFIQQCGREDNFWGPTGAEGPCGPTTEIYINGTEIWNLVFNEYYCDKDKTLTPLEQKGVDTGIGLERLAVVLQNKLTVFETDLFEPMMSIFDAEFQVSNSKQIPDTQRIKRIIADHTKAAVFLASEGIFPSNAERGYVLRRLLRRAIRYGRVLGLPKLFLIPLAQRAIDIYRETYPELSIHQTDILTILNKEEEQFEKMLGQGLKEFERLAAKGELDENSFYLYESYGFPLELTEELARERGIKIDRQKFQEAFKKHQEISRAGREKKFGGHGLILDTGEIRAATTEELEKVTRLHTATHLLQAALRHVLGPEVRQAGSDITAERTRFDFTFSRKIRGEELEAIEKLVQEKIDENLPVTMREVLLEQALAEGALTVPGARYPERVKVYSVDNFSKEVCGGPHVENTGKIGKFKILKEEAVAAGVRRVRATVE